MGTSASLAANSFTLSSMSDKRQVLSWIKRLVNTHTEAERNMRESEMNFLSAYSLVQAIAQRCQQNL